MYLLSFAFTKWGAPTGFWEVVGRTPAALPHVSMLASLANLFWVALGNMIGGVLVGIVCWFAYLRTRGPGDE